VIESSMAMTCMQLTLSLPLTLPRHCLLALVSQLSTGCSFRSESRGYTETTGWTKIRSNCNPCIDVSADTSRYRSSGSETIFSSTTAVRRRKPCKCCKSAAHTAVLLSDISASPVYSIQPNSTSRQVAPPNNWHRQTD